MPNKKNHLLSNNLIFSTIVINVVIKTWKLKFSKNRVMLNFPKLSDVKSLDKSGYRIN
jgi:hypothetical protein